MEALFGKPCSAIATPVAHRHTAAFCRMIDRSRMPDHAKAYFKWLAWTRWSSRSCANIHHLKTDLP